MKYARFLLLLTLSLALCLAASTAVGEAQWSASAIRLGSEMPDFTVDTVDGGSFTLSEALKEKDMVLINLWATWCGPCAAEFPYMEEAWQQYRDQVAIIALTIEPSDDNATLAAYVAEHGMTFPVGSDMKTNLSDYFSVEAIPTSIVVDRFGRICYVESGSMPSYSSFARLFDAFIGDDYAETRVLYELPPAKPTVSAADPAELAVVLADAQAPIVLSNMQDEYIWPMVPGEKDGRTVLVSTNAGQEDSTSAFIAHVTLPEDGAVAFAFATSTEAAADLRTVSVDGETVKSFGGEHPWTQWALAVPAGEHDITFAYVKDPNTNMSADAVFLDDIALLYGDEAAQALAALPVYPTGDALALLITNEGAREVLFSEDNGMLYRYFNTGAYWIVQGDTAEFQVVLPAGMEPEAAFVYNDCNGQAVALIDMLAADGSGYAGRCRIDSVEETGYAYSDLYVYPSTTVQDPSDILGVMVFANEENVNAFVEMMAQEAGLNMTWTYADGSASDIAAQVQSPDREYTVYFVDQYGDPVPGCIVNFCTDEMCQPCVANGQGVVVFTGAPYPYHLQVIRVPDGYAFDTAQEFTADENGGEMTFTVTRK